MEFELTPTSTAPRRARAATRPVVEDLPEALAWDLQLLLTELVTNSMRHGNLRRDDAVRVTLDRRADTVRVVVQDPGQGFAPAQTPPVATPDREAGFGLQLVSRIADRWGVAPPPPTTVWFELDLPKAGRLRSSAR